jgi:hypothetical protein
LRICFTLEIGSAFFIKFELDNSYFLKSNLLYIFLFFWSVSFSQIKNGPRVPDIKDGNILLYKSDTLIVSYYWFSGDVIDLGGLDCRVRLSDEFYYYQYSLQLQVKNLTNDTVYVKYKFKTYEAKPNEYYTSFETKEGYEKYGFSFIEPKKSSGIYGFYANSANIVDFTFEEFVIKFKSGKTLFITKELNKNKQLTYRKLIQAEE